MIASRLWKRGDATLQRPRGVAPGMDRLTPSTRRNAGTLAPGVAALAVARTIVTCCQAARFPVLLLTTTTAQRCPTSRTVRQGHLVAHWGKPAYRDDASTAGA